MRRTAGILLGVLIAAPLAAADRFVVDSEHSRIGFSVPYDFMILGELEGEFHEFTGEVTYDRAAPEASAVWVEIVTSSVDTKFSARDIGLRSDDFLAVESYPTARFEGDEVASGPSGLLLRGELTMRGIAEPVEIEFDLLDLGDTLVVQGRSSLSRKAFDVTGPQVMGDVVIADRVSLHLQLVFRLDAGGS